MEADTDGVLMIVNTDGEANGEVGTQGKTELQRELELFEASEREEEAQFLSAIRPERRDAEAEEGAAPPNDVAVSKPCANVGRKKRGRKPKAQSSSPSPSPSQHEPQPRSRKKEEEDVCFVCFDGGELVLCDRRSCPKAYHPSCVGRDEAFFKTKGSWACGWHVCSLCEKPARFMCYTCTYSVCKGCIKEAEFLCVRKNRGFCESCMQLVLMIEQNKEVNSDGVKIDFTDKETWEYLFKDYWLELKEKLSLTLVELQKAKNPFKDIEDFVEEDAESDETFDEGDESVSSSDSGSDRLVEEQRSVGLKRRKRSRTLVIGRGDVVEVGRETSRKETSVPREFSGWASEELKEFIAYVNEDPEKVISLFEVQHLLLTYIKQNKLQDPRKKSLIICDERLRSLFGKLSVGQFEMLKLLEKHFASKQTCFVQGNSMQDNQDGPANNDDNRADLDDSKDKVGRIVTDKRRKPRKKVEDKAPKSNPNDYAAINVHNVGLIYLRRALIEDLLEDLTSFDSKIIGSFVRIRIPGIGNRQEMYYRLVQVVGTRKVEEAYNTGRKTTDIMLEIANLKKKEDVSIDAVSNQDFTEEECKRLRQSVRCGLVNRPTVSELEEKAKALHEVKLNDWFETELLRLSHLRDRASEKGRRKELRECVEKLQLLSSPAERARKLQETPEVIADPNVGLDYDSDDNDTKVADNVQGTYSKQWENGLTRRGWDGNSPGRRVSGEHWDNAPRNSGKNWDNNRRNISSWGNSGWERGHVTAGSHAGDRSSHGWSQNHSDDDQNKKKSSWSWGKERDADDLNWESQKNCARVDSGSNLNGLGETNICKPNGWSGSYDETTVLNSSSDWQQERDRAQKSSSFMAECSTRADPHVMENASETEKIWHYQDPQGMIQGPFSMLQLRKWNTTGFFPLDLRIWKTHEAQEDSILLTDAVVGRFHKGSNNWEAKGHFSQTSPGNKTATRLKNNGSGWRGNSASTWTSSERNNANRKSNWQAGSGLGSSGNAAEMKRNSTYQSFGWDNTTGVTEPTKSDNNGWGASQSSETTCTTPSAVEAPKSAKGGWGGGPKDGWGVPKSSESLWPISSTIEAPKSTEGGWGGGSSEGWDAACKISENTLSMPSTVETPKSTKGGWGGVHGGVSGAPQSTESPWKASSIVSVQVAKSTIGGWGGGPNEGFNSLQSSENRLSTQIVEVLKSTKEVWGGGPSDGWGVTQSSEKTWETSATVTAEPPICTTEGWDGGPREGWAAPRSSENMSTPTIEAPKFTVEGWGSQKSSENLWTTPSTVQTPKPTGEGWGTPQNSENMWTSPSAVEAPKSTCEGLDVPESCGNLWITPSTVEASKSTNEGLSGAPNAGWGGGGPNESSKTTNQGWDGGLSEGWGGGGTKEASKSMNEGWGGGGSGVTSVLKSTNEGQPGSLNETLKSTNEGWGGGRSKEASKSNNEGWGGGGSNEGSKSMNEGWGCWGGDVPSDVLKSTNEGRPGSLNETLKSTNKGWGGDSSNEASKSTNEGRGGWGDGSSNEASKSTNEGWGGGPNEGWQGGGSNEASKSSNEGWGGGASSGGWHQPFRSSENADLGNVTGKEAWSSQTSYRNPVSAGKFRSRPPSDGFRSSRNTKKDIPCKFHARGFCRKGSSCEFRHV